MTCGNKFFIKCCVILGLKELQAVTPTIVITTLKLQQNLD